jgi:hypothetical protein
MDETNEFINNLIADIPDYQRSGRTSNVTLTNNAIYSSFAWSGAGTGNISVNPQFADATNGDLTPQNAALQAGIPVIGVEYDFNMIERDAADPTIGAIEMATDTTNVDDIYSDNYFDEDLSRKASAYISYKLYSSNGQFIKQLKKPDEINFYHKNGIYILETISPGIKRYKKLILLK